MSSSTPRLDARVVAVDCTEDELRVKLADGRTIAAPLQWFPRLQRATPEQRRSWQPIGRGIGIHWDAVDEDVSIRGLLATQ